MNSTSSKAGVFIPKYTQYSPDGLGRDYYIVYNNGGLLDKLNQVKIKDNYDIISSARYFNTKRNVAPFKYRSDGSGRDSYVLHEHGGLERDHKSLKTYHLKDFLRRPESHSFNFRSSPMREGVNNKTLYLSRKEYNQNQKVKSIEKDLADRLYYSEKKKFTLRENKPKEINYRMTLRNYNTQKNFNQTNGINISNNNMSNLNNKNNMIIEHHSKTFSNKFDVQNLPKILVEENIDNSILNKIKPNNYPKGNILNFLNNKQKIKQRLHLISQEKLNISNQSFGKRIIVKDFKNTILEDKLSNTTKNFN